MIACSMILGSCVGNLMSSRCSCKRCFPCSMPNSWECVLLWVVGCPFRCSSLLFLPGADAPAPLALVRLHASRELIMYSRGAIHDVQSQREVGMPLSLLKALAPQLSHSDQYDTVFNHSQRHPVTLRCQSTLLFHIVTLSFYAVTLSHHNAISHHHSAAGDPPSCFLLVFLC